MTPQQSRVLRALIQRAAHGVTRVDFQAPTIDGGAPILNFPARIEQLRKMGYAIPPSTERRNSCNVYVLQRDASPVVEGEPDAPARLFAGVEVGRGQRSAIFGNEEAA